MIDVKNISKTFISHSTEVKALVNVTARIDPGEVVVFLGPSGSGKSTFIRCLNYLNVADEGSIIIDGIDILNPNTEINKVRAEVGTPEHFFKNPNHERTKLFLSQIL
ncbi:MAG: ATP-binding cassette domain-containing protein [Desulfobacterales bacterium]